ncbi:MAG TPA: DUF4845 domain-containing protein [Steroidobacteraceae bacterium]|nr:DUF4845 domain-containing protein [Steroidobacteraceae bacterium]
MRRRQNGITFIGWLFLLLPVAIVGYAVIRLTPVYLNYMKVNRSLTQTATEFKGDGQLNQAEVRKALQRRWDIESIDYPLVNDVSVAREGEQWFIEANYEDQVKLFGSLSLLMHFDKRVTVK